VKITKGTRVTGHIDTRAGRIEFAGIAHDVYPTGDSVMATVVCDDGITRSARFENIEPEQLDTPNVASVLGGKTHLGDEESLPVPFPLCGSGSRNTRTRYRAITQAVTCSECSGILARRAGR
jgi:hypothetical protein